MVDVTILTCKAYYQPKEASAYTDNILLEYQYLKEALQARGLSVARTYWDDPSYDWTQTKAVVFRTIWDYFERFDTFWPWLQKVQTQTKLINPMELIQWNIDKHYLKDLAQWGVPVVPTVFVDKNKPESLAAIAQGQGWGTVVIKPAIAGGGFLTYKFEAEGLLQAQELFDDLVGQRDMLVQGYIERITTKGEISLMVFDGTFTHAVLKKAKPGDFRVQDDFGGTVHPYQASTQEVALAEKVMALCQPTPAYGRVDVVWDDLDQPMVSELEIIEPELWVRACPESAVFLARGIARYLSDKV
jgi:glutathione synthase/RimK-type ligase-like ATP-grasp enzyme